MNSIYTRKGSFNKKLSGVTLLELAIVVVIIALIAGSVVAGKFVIRNAEMREMLSEYDRYLKAIVEFQDKYNQLPGDFTAAETYWGTDPDGCPFGAAGSAPQRATCNGDGSGTIGSILDPALGTRDITSLEWFRAWQHLSNAGLIEGVYSGTFGPTGVSANGGDTRIGINVPTSALKPGGWLFYYYLQTSDSATLHGDNYGHLMFFGATAEKSTIFIYRQTTETEAAILTPAEALSVDTKIDDAKPGLGTIRMRRGGVLLTGCVVNNADQSLMTYDTTTALPACALIFNMGF